MDGWQRAWLGRPVDDDAREARVAAWLFGMTCTSVFGVHLFGWQQQVGLRQAVGSFIFTLALMSVLVAHEAGHFLAARRFGFRLSLPWFLPAPFLVGTLGAIIRVRERPSSRGGLMVMGAAGPLAGVVVVAVLLVLRAFWAGEADPTAATWTLRRPLLWWIVGAPLGRVDPPTPADPLGFAAWIGCLVTAMNLWPMGQLDGGHILGAWRPRWRRAANVSGTALLLVGGFLWPPWAVWGAILHAMGAMSPLTPKSEAKDLTGAELAFGIAALCAWLLCFTPMPTSW